MKNIQIDAYIDQFPVEVQDVLKQMRDKMFELMPTAEERMTYGIPTYKLNNTNVVHFAGFKNHIGFYPTPSGVKSFKDQLVDFKTTKGAIQFPLNQPIPFELVERIVKFRIEEVKNEGFRQRRISLGLKG